MEIPVLQDRDSSFQPPIVPKRKKDIVGIDDKIISMYAKGMTTRQISATLMDIYGFDVDDDCIFVLSRYFHGAAFERKQITKHEHYTFQSGGKMIDLDALVAKLEWG